MLAIFDHFGFTAEQTERALEVARSEDVNRMDDAAIGERLQIHSRKLSKWRDVLTPAQVAHFEVSHGELIRELGYEPFGATLARPKQPQISGESPTLSKNPGFPNGPAVPKDPQPLNERSVTAAFAPTPVPPLADEPEVGLEECPPVQPPAEFSRVPAGIQTTPDAGIRLWADGAFIRPTTASQGTYTFVVPSGRQRVRLESHHAVSADPRARRRGVRVSEVSVRSDAGEIVTAADDPALAMGWHDPEYVGMAVWRWTDGSAVLPWTNVCGPAVVTVRCMTLPEYAIRDETPGY
jgi:hypothetical protein